MPEILGWNHPIDESDQWDGFNHPGIEYFRGNPMFHLAREAIQNAVDAADDGEVEVRFRLKQVDTASVPHLDQLKKTMKCCLNAAEDEGDKALVFFKNAKKILEQKHLPVLEVSDLNTTGLKGPPINGTPYYAFMKATGQSKKESETATGSYGIGKFAPYAVSDLRTIFVSTVYKNGDSEWHQLTQGKSVLMSHDKGEERRRGVGFWGIMEKCRPIDGFDPTLDGWIQRASKKSDFPYRKGTTISILAFKAPENWCELLAVSVAENFFAAIKEGNLSVTIDDHIVLNRENIREFFYNKDLLSIIMNQNNEPDHFKNCQSYLEALFDEDEIYVEETEHRDLGLCKVRILLGEKLPKRVCILRNGMLITDELNRLRSFSDFKEFSAVVQFFSKRGNEFVRAMEPPTHNDLNAELLSTPKLQKRGKRALKELAKWVREMLKRHAKDPVSEVTTIDELKEFFGEEGTNGAGKGTEELNPGGDVIIRAKPIRHKTAEATLAATDPQGEGGAGHRDGKGGGGGGGGEGGGEGAGSGGKGSEKKPLNKLSNVRSIMIGLRRRRIGFTPDKSGPASLRFMESGADVDYDVKITASDKGVINNGRVEMTLEAGSRCTIEVEMAENFTGSMRILAYEI